MSPRLPRCFPFYASDLSCPERFLTGPVPSKTNCEGMKIRGWVPVLLVALLAFNGLTLWRLGLPQAQAWFGSWVGEQQLGYALAGLLSLLLLIPPLWLSRRVPVIRRKRGRVLLLLFLYNTAIMAGLIRYAHSPRIQPEISASATPTINPTPIVALSTAEPEATRTPTALVKPEIAWPQATPTSEVRPPATADSRPEPGPAVDDFAEIDRHALAATPADERDLKSLARYLVGPARNDREKTRAIYRWVTDRIAYDADAFFRGDLPGGAAEETLRRRLSVCDGYSKLTQALGREAGLDVEIISGFARGYGADSNKGENHAWNAVHLPEGWCLLDTTWGAGSLGDDHKFHKKFEEFYFLPPAERLATTHWPKEKRWLLLDRPFSWEQFQQQPKLSPEFYQLGLKLPSTARGAVTASPTATVELIVPRQLVVTADLRSRSGQSSELATAVYRSGDRARIHIMAPCPGDFQVRVYAGAAEQTNFAQVAEYSLKAESGQAGGYPQLSKSMQIHQARLISPLSGVLSPGKHRFEIEIAGAETVFVDSWDTPLRRQGDRFIGDVEVKAGKVQIFAAFTSDRGEGIVSYQVR